jgi:hypothetical protein
MNLVQVLAMTNKQEVFENSKQNIEELVLKLI